MLGFNNLIIVYCDYGRIGNRLHTHANALAWCIENNCNLINLSFWVLITFKNSSVHNWKSVKRKFHLNYSLVGYLETF